MANSLDSRFPAPTSRSRTPRVRLVGAAVASSLALIVSACGGITNVSDYGDDLKANFVRECETETFAENTTTSIDVLSDTSTCECIYTEMKDRFSLSFDDLKAYEDELADATEGDVPTPPEEITKAIAFCTAEGPQPETSEDTGDSN